VMRPAGAESGGANHKYLTGETGKYQGARWMYVPGYQGPRTRRDGWRKG